MMSTGQSKLDPLIASRDYVYQEDITFDNEEAEKLLRLDHWSLWVRNNDIKENRKQTGRKL